MQKEPVSNVLRKSRTNRKAPDATSAAMPRNVKPMLATSVAKPFDHPDWIFEIKWDGYRAIAEVERGVVRLYSRNNLSMNERYPSIAASLAKLGHDAVLDGEIVVLDREGRAQFQLLQNHRARQGVLAYYVFDLLYLDGHDLRGLPLLHRKELLTRLAGDVPGLRVSEHIAERGTAFFEVVTQRQLEGMVAKLATSKYVTGERSRAWLKIKTQLRQQAVIGGFALERGSRNRLGALLLGVYQGGQLVYIGSVGTGFNQWTVAEVRETLEPLITEACPFKRNPKPNKVVRWVRPELVCEISFLCWTDDGHVRQPVFQGMQDGVPAAGVRREDPEECEAT